MASRLTDASERAAFVEESTKGDDTLRDRLRKLLDAADQDAFQERLLAEEHDARNVREPGEENSLAETKSLPTIGSYKLLEELGEGGMGVVYMARQQAPIRRVVAIKVIKPGMDSRQVVARFEAERQSLAMMNHPNIAKVLEAGTTDRGHPYFVMELVKGLPITEFCDRHRLSVRQRLNLFVTVCRAVEHAHQKGVIHRDLKPSNILVELQDVEFVPKIIDFGVAKAVAQPLCEESYYTGFAQMIGTPLYMSPEQAELNSLDVDTRSDVYSLGVLLYELVAGTTPFDRDELKHAEFDEMRRIIREVDPPRPSKRVSTLDVSERSTVSELRTVAPNQLELVIRGDLDWIVMRALQKDRRLRYQAAADLASDIQNLLEDRPVSAHPPSSSYLIRKWIGRHRAAFFAVFAATLFVVAFIVMTWQHDRETTRTLASEQLQRQRAERSLQTAARAVDDMYLAIATRWFDHSSSATRVQERFLQKAKQFYREVVDETKVHGNDAQLVATSLERLAVISHFLSEETEALKALDESIQQSENELQNGELATTSLGIDLLRRYRLRATWLLERGDVDAAWRDLSSGLGLLEEIRKTQIHPDDYSALAVELALSHGEYLMRVGKLEEAKAVATKLGKTLLAADRTLQSTRSYEITQRLLLGVILAAQEDFAAAEQQAVDGLKLCRELKSWISDDRFVLLIEAELLELLASIDESQGRLQSAKSRLMETLEIRRQTSKSQREPSQAIVPMGPIGDDDEWDPLGFCRYNETQLHLARILLRQGLPYDAGYHLGQCSLSSYVITADGPEIIRYQVLEANTWALIGQLLTSEQSRDAQAAFDYAILVWRETLDQFPEAKRFRSGLHLGQDDYAWFRSILRPADMAKLDSDAPLPIHKHGRETPRIAFDYHATGRSWFDAGKYKAAIYHFKLSASSREDGQEYDWLYLALAHLKQLDAEEAAKYLRMSEHAISSMDNPPAEIVELMNTVRARFDERGYPTKLHSDVPEEAAADSRERKAPAGP